MRGRRRENARRSPYRSRARSLPVKGTKGDEDRYYRCWNCGFPANDVEDGTLGGPEDGEATVLTLVENNDVFPLVFPFTFAGGGNVYEVSGGGCPLCHTTNWRGDHR